MHQKYHKVYQGHWEPQNVLLPSLITLSDLQKKIGSKKCIIESVDKIILWATFSLEARNYKYLAIRDLLGEEIISLENSELLGGGGGGGLIFQTAVCVIEPAELMAIIPWARIRGFMPLPVPSSPDLTSTLELVARLCSWIPIVEPVNMIEQTIFCMQITIASTQVHHSAKRGLAHWLILGHMALTKINVSRSWLVLYTAVFSVVTQCSTQQGKRNSAWRH